MTHPIKRLVRMAPDRVTSIFKETVFEEMYHRRVSNSRYWQKVTVQTEVGEFELTVPDDATVPGGKSYSESVHEPCLVNALGTALDKDAVFYDIGSRYGYFIGVALAAGIEQSNIHAFEQNGGSFKILQSHWGDRIEHLNQCYVGDGSGEQSIDRYVLNNDPPDVIKIDVEGAEMSVLRSSEETLDEDQPTLFMEMHPQRLIKRDTSATEVCDRLMSHGYEVRWVEHRRSVEEGTWTSLLDVQPPEDSTYLIRAER